MMGNTILSAMSGGFDERLNLPLTTEMHDAIQKQAKEEGISVVGFIRKCIHNELRGSSRIKAVEDRLNDVEKKLEMTAEKKHDEKSNPKNQVEDTDTKMQPFRRQKGA